jgi:hypothetical protein
MRRVDDRVHVVHVGPTRLPNFLAHKYHWLPSLSTGDFEFLLGSVDLLFTANVSASTISKALVTGIPISVLVNSHSVTSMADFREKFGSAFTENECWIESVVPIFPFFLWPLGYYDFLQPIIRNNRLFDIITLIEMLETAQAVEHLRNLLFDDIYRERVLQQQMDYAKNISRLPTGASLIQRSTRKLAISG